MGKKGETSRDLATSVRRIVAMAVAIAFHLFLLMGLLRPATPYAGRSPLAESDATALKLRFVVSPRRTSALTTSPAPPPSVLPRKLRVNEIVPTPRVTVAASPPSEADAARAPSAPAPPDPYTDNQPTRGDGGFRDRMLNAQHDQGIHGVPGSDRRVAPGIELADPAGQGIGAVMHNTQRLFGVTNHHCIDVDVWQHLNPDELKARHLTAEDVEKQSQKYNCNQPLGLHF